MERPVHMAVSLSKMTFTDLGFHPIYSPSFLHAAQILHGFMITFVQFFKSLFKPCLGYFSIAVTEPHNQGNL